MNIAVVDDEEAIREQIGGFIKKRNPDFHISGEKVYLTRKKHNEFVKAYMWYLQNGGVSCV